MIMAKVEGKCYLQQLNGRNDCFDKIDNHFVDHKQKIILLFRTADDGYDDDNCGYI